MKIARVYAITCTRCQNEEFFEGDDPEEAIQWFLNLGWTPMCPTCNRELKHG